MKKNLNIINKKVGYEYFFIEQHIVGLKLTGNEVKSIKEGRISLTDTFCFIQNGEIFVKNLNIENYKESPFFEKNRQIKLLMKKREINKLEKNLIKGLTIVPYRIFLNDRGLIKMEIVLAKGKKLYDKKEKIKEKDIQKELSRKIW